MKRRELLKLFAKAGWYLKRNGSQHDIYTNGVDRMTYNKLRKFNSKR